MGDPLLSQALIFTTGAETRQEEVEFTERHPATINKTCLWMTCSDQYENSISGIQKMYSRQECGGGVIEQENLKRFGLELINPKNIYPVNPYEYEQILKIMESYRIRL